MVHYRNRYLRALMHFSLILVLRPCFAATSTNSRTIIDEKQNLTDNEDTYPRIESVTLSMGSDGKVTYEDFKGIPQTSVAVIGCGPGGMFFLHALATKRKQLEEAGDIEALTHLPIVTVFEKSASPGGVWRSDRNRNEESDGRINTQAIADASTNMYEGLWTNGFKDSMEFFDYTFEDHFKTPQPVYLPRKHILEYMMARVTKHKDIFQDVLFNTAVESVTYDNDLKQFVIISRDKGGIISTRHFDKCIWAAGAEGIPNTPEDIIEKLVEYKGQVVHSSAMDKLVGSSSDGKNAVEGKIILLIGDSYSAEDLALQCIKLGAEKIYFTSRYGKGSAVYMGSWPGDKVKMLEYAEVSGVKNDGTGKTIMFDSLKEEYPIPDVEDVSIIIFCTGYKFNLGFVDDTLQPWKKEEDCGTWHMEEFGGNKSTWRMKENSLTSTLGHVEPAEELELNSHSVYENSYRKLLISNPNMMYMFRLTVAPLLEIDVMAWLCLSYITGEMPIPSKEEMIEANKSELLESMQYVDTRVLIDEAYSKAMDHIPLDHWAYDLTSERYEEYYQESYSYQLRLIARDMKDGNYPISLGDMNGLNELGKALMRMGTTDARNHQLLKNCDEDTKKWKTFRDSDPSPFRSYITGMGSVPLQGKWLEIDDEGNPNVPTCIETSNF